MKTVMDSSCKDCTKRQIGCHGHCERYAAWKAGQERKKLLIKKSGCQVWKRGANDGLPGNVGEIADDSAL